MTGNAISILTIPDWKVTNQKLWSVCLTALSYTYLLVCHEFNCRLGCNFNDIDSISSPQGPHSPLSDHLHKPSCDLHAVTLRGMNLRRTKSVCIQVLKWQMSLSVKIKIISLCIECRFYLHEHFESVKWSCAGSRHRSSSSSGHQVSPPHSCFLLLGCEFIRHYQTLPNIQNLRGRRGYL